MDRDVLNLENSGGDGPSPVPEFAVVGHPNEGKSSVVSTLTEDDRVKISPVPGETRVSGAYTVEIQGEEIIRFVDTPGFQVPRQTLAWFKAYEGPMDKLLPTFLNTFQADPFYGDECELLAPVARGAGIIYVVNGARPVRPDDRAEMEILRLTGRPRMAVINTKEGARDYTEEWRQEFSRHFNSVRIFNSNTADFGERIRMLESLKSIDQTWERALEKVIRAFRRDWDQRNHQAAALILEFIQAALGLSMSEKLSSGKDPEQVREGLTLAYHARLRKMEKKMFDQVRRIYRHTLYQVSLSSNSLLSHDLFSRTTWELLGLNQTQLATAGAVMGGSMGVMADVAAQGLSFGVFTALGGLIGAGSAVLGGRRMTGARGLGRRLGGDYLKVGPCRDLQFLYILLDRALMHHGLIISRPHGRRDQAEHCIEKGRRGISTRLSSADRKVCARFFQMVNKGWGVKQKERRRDFKALVETLVAGQGGPDR